MCVVNLYPFHFVPPPLSPLPSLPTLLCLRYFFSSFSTSGFYFIFHNLEFAFVMATRGIQRRSFGNIWDNSKTSSSSSSSKKNLDATKDIAFYREKAERAAQRVARNHPTYGKGREVAPNDAALKSRADRTHGMGRRGKYFVNKKGRAYGQAKKGGGGGSFTWGAPGDEMLSVNTDAGDPNYNSEEENDDILFTDEFGREHLSASEPWASPSRNGYTGPPRMSSRIPRPHQSLKYVSFFLQISIPVAS